MQKVMQSKIQFYVNGELRKMSVRPDQTALEVLHDDLGLYGTRETCAEGDCGACTIAVGAWQQGLFIYKAINSCTLSAVRMHQTHIITVEGLAEKDILHPIQRVLIAQHGSQCGFCTPGIIMSLFCLFQETATPSRKEIYAALEGNLCRCTGYDSIRESVLELIPSTIAKSPVQDATTKPSYCREVETALRDMKPILMEDTAYIKQENDIAAYYVVHTLSDLETVLESLSGQHYQFINGGTDVWVEHNVKYVTPDILIDISQLADLQQIEIHNESLMIGGMVTQSMVQESDLVNAKLPILAEVVGQMASRQVRNVGSLSGNIANASPVADGAVALYGLGSILHCWSPRGWRKVTLTNFYRGYKQRDLAQDEIIGKIEIPLTTGLHSFVKSSKRLAVDITSVSSYAWIQVEHGIVKDARFAFAGVAAFIVASQLTQKYLLGQPLSENTFQTYAEAVAQEFNPISDVRGSAAFRRILLRNQVMMHYLRFAKEIGGCHE